MFGSLPYLKLKVHSIPDLALAWILFFSVFFQKLAPIGFIVWLIYWLFELPKTPIKLLLTNCWSAVGRWFILYYLLLCFGLIWTQNSTFALSKLENKMVFILFPVLFLNSKITMSIKDFKNLFCGALVFTLLFLEFFAAYRWLFHQSSQPSAYFAEPYFTVLMHRGYFACYLVIGLIFILERAQKQLKPTQLLLCIFLTVGVLQTGSKSGLICLILVFICYVIWLLFNHSKKYLITSILLFALLIGGVFFTKNQIRDRFESTLVALAHTPLENNSSIESNAARLLMWNTSWQVWKAHFFFGAGTGDYNDVLVAKNKEYRNWGVVKEELNSHNQFLNTGVQLGFTGVLLLILLFVTAAVQVQKHIWHLLVLSVFLINFLLESFLETQAGIVLFCVLLVTLFKQKPIPHHPTVTCES